MTSIIPKKSPKVETSVEKVVPNVELKTQVDTTKSTSLIPTVVNTTISEKTEEPIKQERNNQISVSLNQTKTELNVTVDSIQPVEKVLEIEKEEQVTKTKEEEKGSMLEVLQEETKKVEEKVFNDQKETIEPTTLTKIEKESIVTKETKVVIEEVIKVEEKPIIQEPIVIKETTQTNVPEKSKNLEPIKTTNNLLLGKKLTTKKPKTLELTNQVSCITYSSNLGYRHIYCWNCHFYNNNPIDKHICNRFSFSNMIRKSPFVKVKYNANTKLFD